VEALLMTREWKKKAWRMVKERVHIDKGMALEVTSSLTEKKSMFSLEGITCSGIVVKKVVMREVLPGGTYRKKVCHLYGKRIANKKSATFVDVDETIEGGWWQHVNDNECVRLWIGTSFGSIVTHKFIFRIERDKNDIIVYGFFPYQ
jgi:hypothetical protein